MASYLDQAHFNNSGSAPIYIIKSIYTVTCHFVYFQIHVPFFLSLGDLAPIRRGFRFSKSWFKIYTHRSNASNT